MMSPLFSLYTSNLFLILLVVPYLTLTLCVCVHSSSLAFLSLFANPLLNLIKKYECPIVYVRSRHLLLYHQLAHPVTSQTNMMLSDYS